VSIALPVKLDDAVGQTHNISASGIYITFPRTSLERVERGAAIAVEMLFEHANPEGPLVVVCEGEVVRVDRLDDQVGLAARITSYRFASAAQTDSDDFVPRVDARSPHRVPPGGAGGQGDRAEGNT
jgi:hypothetical protein